MLPSIPSPVSRDQAAFFGSSQGQAWMSGNWTWLAILIVLFVLNTVLGEELLFRGLMLPRMARFGRADWVVNGVLFAWRFAQGMRRRSRLHADIATRPAPGATGLF
jgi:membrane protease YdiL (CAAX protease family)